jgi:hypothetical protein
MSGNYNVCVEIVGLQMVFQWIVKPQTVNKVNEMFLPGRTAFVFDMVSSFALLPVPNSATVL